MKKTALALAVILLLQLAILFMSSNLGTAGPPSLQITATSQIDSPKNMTYTSGEIPLSVVVTGDASGRYYGVEYRIIYLNAFSPDDPEELGTYCDDGKPKVYNSTLNLKQDGQYELRVTISYTSTGVYRQIYFSVQTNQPTPSPSPEPSIEPTQSPEPQPEPFPTTLAIASSVIIAVVCIVALVHLKKHKQNA